MVYLVEHKPARSQFRSPRRSRPTGLTVIHTAESVLDSVGPDTGAENVADFIRRRSTPGSYHDLVDSDSAIQLVRYGDEAYQDGTGSNRYALSISFALRTTDWRKLSPAKRAAFLRQGAKAFARQQAWLKANGYPTTPLRRVTRAQSEKGVAGFISHAERDPARRTDPGSDFPWSEFFAACRAALGGTTTSAPTTPEDDMPLNDTDKAWIAKTVREQVWNSALGKDGTSPGNRLLNVEDRVLRYVDSPSSAVGAALRAEIKALVGAINALAKGEQFDEAKLLASIEEASRKGTEQGILDAAAALRAIEEGAK